jgi:hypothetical protein
MEPSVPPTQPLFVCYQAHRALWLRAEELLERTRKKDPDADLFRLAVSCMQIAAKGALASREEPEAIRQWRVCASAELQIRRATCGALSRGHIRTADYDRTFGMAAYAARARFLEIERLRRRISRSLLV